MSASAKGDLSPFQRAFIGAAIVTALVVPAVGLTIWEKSKGTPAPESVNQTSLVIR